MGRISLSGPDGAQRATAFFGADTPANSGSDAYANDGVITDLEVSDARQRLEAAINENICGYGGPLGLGGWGGISEVCVQPWNMGGPARESTPDGYAMPVSVRLTEEYREPTGFLFFSSYRTVERSVPMTMRWENGRVRLYQCTPPAYAPPPPPPPVPDLGAELVALGSAIGEGVRDFFGGAQRVASSAATSLRRLFS
ncbi:MAG: hypothetical protein U1F66_07590 [bacterium]